MSSSDITNRNPEFESEKNILNALLEPNEKELVRRRNAANSYEVASLG